MTRTPQLALQPELSEDRAVYTVKEAARLLSLSLGGTYTLVRDGTIPAKKIGARWVIPKSRFHAWLDGLFEDAGREYETANVARRGGL